MKIRRLLGVLCSIPKTVVFNFHALPPRHAVRLPCLVHWRTRIVACSRGSVLLGEDCRFAQVRVGFPHMTYPAKASSLKLTGSVKFVGECSLLAGIDLNVTGELVVGRHFACNEGVKIDCKNRSFFGDDVIVGHNCYFSDDDGHTICDAEGAIVNPSSGFWIGDHVWFGRGCLTLKGVKVGPDVVVGAGSILTRSVAETDVVIAGNPAAVVKRGVVWHV
ncbi:MAG: DapH/DapD/GlmU-related protein [Coriobacteriia bacterium]